MNDAILNSALLFGYVSSAVVLALAIGLYLLPTIIGFSRKKRNWPHIAFWNILFGWTIIAWGAMLVEAFKSDGAP